MLLLASVVSVLFSDTTAVAQNETKQLSLLEQPVWSENNNSFKLSLSIKHLDEGDLIEIYTLEELNRNSLKESFISKNSEPTENSFQITLTQEQIIKKEITVELNTNSPTNNSVFSPDSQLLLNWVLVSFKLGADPKISDSHVPS